MNRFKSCFIIIIALLAASAISSISAQAPGDQMTFTLNPRFDQQTNSTFGIYHLASFNNVPSDAVCGATSEGYNLWCGEVVHYAADPTQDLFDFNFTQTFSLTGCNIASSQETTVNTATGRRSLIISRTFSCGDAAGVEYSVQTTTSTNQYRSSCGGRAYRPCWFPFPADQQPLVTGTVGQVTAVQP